MSLKNNRIVLTEDGFYSIVETNYNEETGQPTHIQYHVKPNLGYSLTDVEETLKELLHDVENWKTEELSERTLLRLLENN